MVNQKEMTHGGPKDSRKERSIMNLIIHALSAAVRQVAQWSAHTGRKKRRFALVMQRFVFLV